MRQGYPSAAARSRSICPPDVEPSKLLLRNHKFPVFFAVEFLLVEILKIKNHFLSFPLPNHRVVFFSRCTTPNNVVLATAPVFDGAPRAAMQTFLAMITISSGPGLNQLRLHRVENGLALGHAHPNGLWGKSGRVNHFGPKVAWICAYPDPTSTT